jgi:hypothetical protein
MSEWIKVSDNIPLPNTAVLLCLVDGETQDDRDARIGWWEELENPQHYPRDRMVWTYAAPNVWNRIECVRGRTPTHWMPLPEPPKD